jgi:transglutaminase-like putative cysteine protease
MWLRTSCEIAFDIKTATPFILMLRPRNGAQQWIATESFTLKPSVPFLEHIDGFGNLCQRLVAPPGEFTIRTSADLLTSETIDVGPGEPYVEVQNLPDTVLTYLLPSRYCESDRFTDLSREIVDGAAPGYDQVVRLNQWLRENIRFNPDSPHFQTTAAEVFKARQGVCRELAHLGIALCRGLSIPARMVVGYLFGLRPMNFHAWFEAYVGGRWYTFDPTQEEPRGGRIVVAYGHDAADVALFNQFGPATYPKLMNVSVVQLAEPTG